MILLEITEQLRCSSCTQAIKMNCCYVTNHKLEILSSLLNICMHQYLFIAVILAVNAGCWYTKVWIPFYCCKMYMLMFYRR
jgi:hypothetical protein